MPSFPARFRAKRSQRQPAGETNSATPSTDMPGNSHGGAGNWNAASTTAALSGPPLIVVNPPQDLAAQAVLLVTAVVWLIAAWRRSSLPPRL